MFPYLAQCSKIPRGKRFWGINEMKLYHHSVKNLLHSVKNLLHGSGYEAVDINCIHESG